MDRSTRQGAMLPTHGGGRRFAPRRLARRRRSRHRDHCRSRIHHWPCDRPAADPGRFRNRDLTWTPAHRRFAVLPDRPARTLEPPEAERRRGLDESPRGSPQHGRAQRMLREGAGFVGGCHGRFRWAAAAGRSPAPMAVAMVRASRVVGRQGHAGPARWRWPVGYSMDLAVTRAVARSAWAARSRSIASKLNSSSACGSSMSRSRPAAHPASCGPTSSRRWTPGTISRSTRGAVASAGAAIRRSPWRVVTVRPAAIGTVRAANEVA